MTSLHVKNNLKMYKNVEKCKNVEKGRSKCKKSCGETKQRIKKKKEKNHVTLNIILLLVLCKNSFSNEKK